MQFFNYLKYFFYLAHNWNIRIATHIISNEIKGEKKYGINTTGADELNELEEKGIDIEHATIYMPASYDLLEQIFTQANISSSKHFIDIGCGKGRALCVAAHFSVQKVTGIDFSKDLCDAAKLNLLKTQQQLPSLEFKIHNNDAFYFEIPDDADFIDIGCGKGRAMCVAAHFAVQKVTGIDFSKDLCDAAKLNLLKTQQQFPSLQFKIHNNDAFYFEIPDDADFIFMFNPFDEIIMSGVVENIEMSLERAPRKITVIYANPLQKHLFLEQDYKQVFHQIKLNYLEAVILTKSPGVGQG